MLKRIFSIVLMSLMMISLVPNYIYAYNDTIRVGLYYGSSSRDSYNIGSGNLYAYTNDGRVLEDLGNGNYEVSIGVSGEIVIKNSGLDVYTTNDDSLGYGFSDGTCSLSGVKYRGYMVFKKDSGKLAAINYLSMDDYLKGVVGREMSSSWEIEALKAQAVVARNYATNSLGRHSSQGFDVCAYVHCQAYGGMKSEASSIIQAVEETSGEMVYYNGQLAQTYYHSSSGGKTESNENVWGSTAVPYLRGVEDPYSMGYPNDNWTVEVTADEIKNNLAQKGVNIGDIKDVKITKISELGRATELTIYGTEGTKSYTKDNIRSSITSLKSTLFTIEKKSSSNSNPVPEIYIPSNINTELKEAYYDLNEVLHSATNTVSTEYSSGDVYVIKGHGWGHGIGMSQYGAKDMASKGYNYVDIIKFYFTGVEVR